MGAPATLRSTLTPRSARRRRDILDIASDHINRFGVRGMTLTKVAQALRIDTSSITYYFRKKEDLAAACLSRSLDWQLAQAEQAVAAGDARAAVRAFLHAHVEVHRAPATSGEPQLAVLSDMRSMQGERQEELFARYREAFRVVRRFFERDSTDRDRSLLGASVVMATAHWLSGWLGDYGEADFARVEQRLFDILDRGLGAGPAWRHDGVAPAEPDQTSAQTQFLHAASGVINAAGYHGASVEKIAAVLGVSTGSFYHHLDNKDDLVLACFERSHALVEATLAAAAERSDDHAERLADSVSALVRVQFAGERPLMRASAYQALPPELRDQMLRRNGRIARRLAGAVADGITQGTLRAVDPLIAGEVILALVNAAGGLRPWAGRGDSDASVARFAGLLERGIF